MFRSCSSRSDKFTSRVVHTTNSGQWVKGTGAITALASTTDSQLRECHKALISDMSLSEFASSYREVCGHFPGKASSETSPRDVIRWSTCKTDCSHTLTVALARLLAAKPHSADVERLISSYNQLKTSDRSALSANTLSATLFIRHNMPPVAQWDPRPATCCWMTVKSRRPDQNPAKAKKQDYFKGVFFLIISLWFWILAKFVSTPHWN